MRQRGAALPGLAREVPAFDLLSLQKILLVPTIVKHVLSRNGSSGWGSDSPGKDYYDEDVPIHRAGCQGTQRRFAVCRIHIPNLSTGVILCPAPRSNKKLTVSMIYARVTLLVVGPVLPHHFDGGGIGESVFEISTTTFQVPSACFFHTVAYLPWSVIALPLRSVIVISYVPTV